MKSRRVRHWHNDETLTETEGRILEASRDWLQAEADRKLWADLEAREVIIYLLLTTRDGKQALLDAGVSVGLTAKEIIAFQTIGKFWKREAKEKRRLDKARRKAERAERAGEATV